jgi:hypothetical protein
VQPPQVQQTQAQASLGGQGQGTHGQGALQQQQHFRAFAQGFGQQQPFGSVAQGYGAAHHLPGFGAGSAVHGAPQMFGAGVHGAPQGFGAGAPQGFGAGLAAQGAPQGYGAGLAALGALDIARLRDLAAVSRYMLSFAFTSMLYYYCRCFAIEKAPVASLANIARSRSRSTSSRSCSTSSRIAFTRIVSPSRTNGSRWEVVQQKVSPSRVILRTFKVHAFLRF